MMKFSFKIITRPLSLIAVFCSITSSYAQEGKINNANKIYEKMGYIKASDIYLEVAEKGYKSEELLKKLADSYYFNAYYIDAAKWYTELFNFAKIEDPLYILRFSQSLRVSGDTKKADDLYADYVGKTKTQSKLITDSNTDSKYDVYPLAINTPGIDFGGFMSNKTFYFSSNGGNDVSKGKNDWDGMSYLNLYQVNIEQGKPEGKPAALLGKLSSRHHDVSACITKDGKTMYFTRNNSGHVKSEKGFKTEYLKIYRAKFINDEWTDIEDLPINGAKFSTAHPVLNKTEDKLYFVSDRPESIGQTDIFYCAITKDGTFGEVVNAGKGVNTVGRESFPFVYNDQLYFSSDGHLGFGGYDVFYASSKDNFSSVTNVGKPINSNKDDFAYYFNEETKNGFISSNRDGGKGNDDIYGFKKSRTRISGLVSDLDTVLPVENCIVTLFDKSNNIIGTTMTGKKGNYEILPGVPPAFIRVSKEGYDIIEKDIPESCTDCEINIAIKNNVVKVKEGADLAKVLNIKDIYFDFDKWNITKRAEVDLEKIFVVLTNYPEINLAIKSHTDSRGNDNYNMTLSENRAQSTLSYLVSKGISSSRLTAKGYGESKLINKCINGSKCSEEQHQLNRRSEFTIELQNK